MILGTLWYLILDKWVVGTYKASCWMILRVPYRIPPWEWSHADSGGSAFMALDVQHWRIKTGLNISWAEVITPPMHHDAKYMIEHDMTIYTKKTIIVRIVIIIIQNIEESSSSSSSSWWINLKIIIIHIDWTLNINNDIKHLCPELPPPRAPWPATFAKRTDNCPGMTRITIEKWMVNHG